jgi:PPM family protein phosphatase
MSEAETIRDTTIIPAGQVDCHGMTSPGRVHSLNADCLLVADLTPYLNPSPDSHSSIGEEVRSGQLLIVADGVGREWLGQRASALAVEYLKSSILTPSFRHPSGQRDDDELVDELQTTLSNCQERLREIATHTPDYAGMGTTITLAYIAWPRLVLAHVGDSRCYLHRIAYLDRLTTDHTIAERMISEGYVSREQLQLSRWHNVLWNTISASKQDAAPEIRRMRLRVGDTLLLCTDGLTRHLSERQIREALEENTSSREACKRLIEMANAQGGEDNITAIVARFHHAVRPAQVHNSR